MKDLSIDLVELFKFSTKQYGKYTSFIIGAMLTFLVLGVIPRIHFMLRAPQQPTTESQFISLIITLAQVFLSLGFIKIMLQLAQDKYVEVVDMFNNFRTFLSYFVASFLYGIAVILGLFLLVVPGIYIYVRFQFYPYIIIEEEVSAFTALKKSFFLSQSLTLELFLLQLVVITLNLLGILLFGVGIVITYPLTTMATAIAYKSITQDSDHIPSTAYKV
ncbi:hypothetical protein [Fodinibius halophilus]|uniref:DUF975 family protein n=1 Tax=Fodinibius halophilus TaxID=1736908 RepID=A0A6M1T9B2_9BACT|nr:hypothetical protein [Fodinibius halophilus]NGP87624.1 hypothetical protein [Fodinibius halophilus]